MDEKPELTKLTSNPDILRIIECPVCHEVPFPPIYQCITGHNICKSCKPKLQECPLCKMVISDKRNYSVEQMVLSSSHSCAYKDEGCKIEGTGEVLGDHFKTCQYRSFKCPGNGNRNTCQLTIKLSQAREHLLETHKSVKTDSNSKIFLPLAFTLIVGDHSKLKHGTSWRPTLIELDGKSFLAQVYTSNDIFYWTLFYLGTEDEAANYNAEITFSSEKKKSARLQWIVPVQPIIKCQELRDGNEMNDVLIPSCTFKDFKKVAERDDGNSRYVFHTEYKISKCE